MTTNQQSSLVTAQLEKLLKENTRRAEAAVEARDLEARRLEEEIARRDAERIRLQMETERVGKLDVLIAQVDSVIDMLYAFTVSSPLQKSIEDQVDAMLLFLELMRLVVSRLIGTSDLSEDALVTASELLDNSKRGLNTKNLESVPRGLSPALLMRTRNVMLSCCPCEDELEALFVDSRLAFLEDVVQISGNRRAQISSLINTLYRKSDSKGRNALVIFLMVLYELHEPNDGCRARINNLIDALSSSSD